jgi:hypothetical protein
MTDIIVSDAPSATPAQAPELDLATIVESKLAAAAPKGDPAGGTSEPKPEATPKAPEEAPKDSAAQTFARAMAAEKKAQEAAKAAKSEREKLDADKAALLKERESLAKELADAKEVLRLIKDDPRALVRRAGESPEAFVKRLATGERVDPKVRELEERLNAAEKAREKERSEAQAEADKRAEESRKQAEDTAVAEFHDVVKASPECGAVAWLMESDPDTARGLLRNAVLEHHKATGKIPSYEEAAQVLQTSLMTDFERMLSVPAFRDRAVALVGAKPAAPPSAKNEKPAQRASQGAESVDVPRTITNEMATGSGAGERELSYDERLERLHQRLESALRG